ncbi:type II toxin-antitoxin system VapC family toxin [Pasteurellaceae bacterium HPA106]|uniref:type II toxin-antitoxin system VapC family toxin n=1 Tax=Spirabiliibacterium pneumoniae TaxID=221400 RepID=UPI001AAC4B70|nr:type II toxin-antitoxin system VapC family toxin [Spirabiliibacterium pneumoniae]MBE2895736.1 type II toxin-antitoxin system VapC family toxin [Spirabiliibacterium pneumoniae]
MGIMKISNISKSSLSGQKFFVDTNIWIYQTYVSGAFLSEHSQKKAIKYSDFIQQVLSNNGKLFTSSLCLSELAHVIEKKSFENYKVNNPNITLKKFRGIKTEREKVISIVSLAWEDIKSISTIIEINITKDNGNHIIDKLREAPLDAYDAYYLLIMENNKISNILTDDKDFQTVQSIDVYSI